MAESEDTYVKIGERGRLIERTATSPRDHINLKATGWSLKGSKGAPTKKDAWADEPETEGLSETVPTSMKAFADAAAEDAVGDKKAGTKTGRGSSSTSTAAGSAGEAADAASQSAAGR